MLTDGIGIFIGIVVIGALVIFACRDIASTNEYTRKVKQSNDRMAALSYTAWWITSIQTYMPYKLKGAKHTIDASYKFLDAIKDCCDNYVEIDQIVRPELKQLECVQDYNAVFNQLCKLTVCVVRLVKENKSH